MKDLIIVGAGGFAREVSFLVDDINRARHEWNFLGYIDRDSDNHGLPIGTHRIIGTEQWIKDHEGEVSVVIGIGAPNIIQRVVRELSAFDHIKFPNLIHPSVIKDPERVQFGEGNIVCGGNIFTTDISIGSFNILNLSCTFGHDCVIGDCNVVNPGVNVSGGVTIEDRCLLGTGCTILQNRKIGFESVVGAGAVVAKDVPPQVTVVGIPAKVLEKAAH